ncbi:MAG: hypothetical protein ACI9OD_000586 [Limisphaerales bacterium]|jgi:hypothetical protein
MRSAVARCFRLEIGVSNQARNFIIIFTSSPIQEEVVTLAYPGQYVGNFSRLAAVPGIRSRLIECG